MDVVQLLELCARGVEVSSDAAGVSSSLTCVEEFAVGFAVGEEAHVTGAAAVDVFVPCPSPGPGDGGNAGSVGDATWVGATFGLAPDEAVDETPDGTPGSVQPCTISKPNLARAERSEGE